MTLEEAASILQIALPCARDDARRAYRRLVKEHKPDRAPELFRQVREAWERLEHAGDPIGAHVATTAFVETRPLVVDEADEARAGAAPPDVLPEDPLIELRERLHGLPFDTEPEAYAAIVREAVEKHPDLPEAHYLLYDELIDRGRVDEAAAVLRAAHERGLPGFLEDLAANHPEALTTEELLHRTTTAGPYEAMALALELARRGRYDEARATALRSLDHDEPPPPLHGYYELFLLLLRGGDHEGAARLHTALSIAEARRPKGSFRATIAGLPADAIVDELGAVASALPERLRRALANALLADLDAGSVSALQIASEVDPDATKRAIATLKKQAPILHSLFGDTLRPAGWNEVKRPPKGSETSSRWLAFLAIFALNAFRHAWSTCEPDPAETAARDMARLQIERMMATPATSGDEVPIASEPRDGGAPSERLWTAPEEESDPDDIP